MALTRIKTGGILDDAVTSAKIGVDVIAAVDLAANSVTVSEISADAVTGAKIADDSIDSEHIVADSIDAEHYAPGTVDATALADNAVTLAKMAGGTDGNIISYDASGDPVAIATGSDGQVLTSTGAGSPPAFEALPSSASAIGDLSDAVTTATSNVGIGSTALDSLSASNGNYNVAVGVNAATALTTGDDNIAIGYAAMDAADGAESDNIAIGTNALGNVNHDSVVNNIAIGVGAADGIGTLDAVNNIFIGTDSGGGTWTTSASSWNIGIGNGTLAGAMNAVSSCIAIGDVALASVTTGSPNIALGNNSAQNITTGANNIAIGNSALRSASTAFTGARNLAIGIGAMRYPDAGSTSAGSGDNIFIGYNSGGGTWANATCGDNVCVGNYTMDAAINAGNANACIGHNAGSALTTGDNNAFLGSSAGDGTTTGGQNVCIGAGSDTDGTGVSNAIAIGFGTISVEEEISLGRVDQHIYTLNNSTSWTASSDERKKKNIQDVSLGLDFVNDLRTVTFQWRPAEERPEEWGHFHYDKDEDGNDIGEKLYSETDTETVHHGMIAQEVKAALDTAGVNGENFEGWKAGKNGEQGVAPSAFVYPLIKAVQELSSKVEALENA